MAEPCKEVNVYDNSQIHRAYEIAAKVVALYGDPYLPIFQRLHAEVEQNDTSNALKRLAMQIAAR